MSYRAYVEVLRNGVRLCTLQHEEAAAPTLTADSAADLKMSMSGVFLADDRVELWGDELRPVVELDGVATPCGVFAAAAASTTTRADGTVWWSIEAYDRCWRVQSYLTENVLHLDAGTAYLAAVEQLLIAAGISMSIKTPSSAVLATAREDWEVGTDYLTIINQLLSEINYAPLWFDRQGFARLAPKPTVDAGSAVWRYSASDVRGVMAAEARLETDLFSAPNVFLVICSNPDLAAPLTATAVNDSPLSVRSTLRRGRRIVSVVQVDNIATQAELQAYADHLAYESMLGDAVISISTIQEPGHGIGDVAIVQCSAMDGVCVESGWSMTLSPAALMTHTLKKVVIT